MTTMLRNIFRPLCSVAFAAIVAATVAGCSDDTTGFDVPEQQPESGYITISLNCVDDELAEASRAGENDAPYTEEGDEDRHENLISTVTLCLWAKGGDKPDDTAKPDYWQTFVVNKELTAEVRVPLTPALKGVLFGTEEATCNAFAAVNVTPTSPDFTITDLRNMAITSTFATQRTQEDFTMDGDCAVSYDDTKKLATGTIPLRRSASKITLALDVDNAIEQTVVIDGNVVTSHWAPDYSGMSVQLNGGLSKSRLDPNLEEKPAQADFFDTPDNLVYNFIKNEAGKDGAPDNGNNPGGKNYSYIQDRPFYTYPHRWSAEPGDYAATYMTLSIPWRAVDVTKDENNNIVTVTPRPNAQWRTCYYQVPVIAADSELLQLVRNVSYHVYLHVGILGSFIPDEPLLLENLEYSAAQWGTEQMDVTIPDVRYLVVDQNSYTVNNENSIAIPFYTSHETVVTDATMTFYRYNFDDVGNELPVTVNMTQNEESAKANRGGAPVFTADFDNKNKVLNVTHDLDIYEAYNNAGNSVSFTNGDGPTVGKRNPQPRSAWDALVSPTNISYFRKKTPVENEYSRVEFKITVQHKDKTGTTNFKEDINITQYPGMYITTVRNYYEENGDAIRGTSAQGNTYVNGNLTEPNVTQGNPSGAQPNGWMTSIGLSSSYKNFNPNMYLVTVTTLPQDTPYKIGDPRSKQINNYLGSGNPANVEGALPSGGNTTAWSGSQYTFTPNQVTGQPTAVSPVTVTGFSQGAAIEGGTRTLRYYYPTQEDDEHKMMIAPKFRICSSYGGTTWVLNRELARRRAAAYQEKGYAAGRWRLPTYGEVSFVMQLAAEYKIPRLFGHSDANDTPWYYWCANGLVCVPPKRATNGSPSLPGDPNFTGPIGANPNATYPNARNPWVQRSRFVYDEWYWGEADLQASGTDGSGNPVYTFTWGDREIKFETDIKPENN